MGALRASLRTRADLTLEKTLISLDEYGDAFPVIPGAPVATVMNELNVLNFGPEFSSVGGVQTLLPPVLGPRYPVIILVPKPDEDGVSIAGIRSLQIRAPLGTNTGWNVRTGFRAPDLCGLSGSFIPFATTKAERLAKGDPRRSLQERY